MGVQGAPSDNNIMVWDAVIYGPADTPFEDGTFKLQIEFSEEYPNKPPKVKFRDISEGTQPYIGTLTLAHPQP